MNIRWSRNDWRRTVSVGLTALIGLPCFLAAAQRAPDEAQIRQMLQRFPDADANKDGDLTPDEFREFRRQARIRGAAEASRPAEGVLRVPTVATANDVLAGPVEIHITSENPVPVNPRVYGIICEEMFVKDLVDEPEYLAALTDLKFKTFNYPGGSISYYHHPQGTGGFNIRPEEVRKSKHGDESRFMKEGAGPDHFEQYMQFVKASGGEVVFTANILNGTVAELDEFLTRLQAEHIPIAAVVLGVEMHLPRPAAEIGGGDGYLERIKPYIAMLQAKYPQVPIVAHSTPVGRVGDRAQASFHDWNQVLTKLPGIDGFSQYGWPEFGTGVRQAMSAATSQTPGERWLQYEEFTRTFPARQLPVYQRDWGVDKKMYMLQWGTHLDRNTPVQGLHMANFYFFLAQYNAAHDDYFAVATSAPILATSVSKGGQRGGVIDKDKIALFASYYYTKPFRHLFSGDKKLLACSIKGVENQVAAPNIKALAAAGPDGRTYLYVINSGPAVALGGLTLDGATLPGDMPLQIESVFENRPSGSSVPASSPFKTFTGEKILHDLTLEPWSLTLLTTPTPGQKTSLRARAIAMPEFAPIQDDPALPRVLLLGDSISVGYTLAVREALAGKANVHRAPANCGNTAKGLQFLSQWLGDGHWDVIHFNWGLHDLTSIDDNPEVPITEYEKNLRELVARLKKTGATLVWCSTTPVPPERRAPLKPEDVVRYNEVAKKIMDENGIVIDDLYAFAMPQLSKLRQPTNVHPTAEGFRVLAQPVAASIQSALKQRRAVKPVADEGPPLAQALRDRKGNRGAASFDMAAYLQQISAKGKERGYKEFVYKQTPEGELRIYFVVPPAWSPDDKRPAVIFFYGGGWSGGNVFSYDEQAEYFAKCGVVAGLADYRVRTRHGVLPDKCVEDARSAVRWVRANARKLGVDPNRVIAGGGSAGGHIAGCTAILDAPNSATDDLKISCIPNGLMLCFPVASLADDSRADAFKQVVGEKLVEALSPARRVTKSWPPTVIFYGNADRLLPGGVQLYNRAREAGVACELYLAEGQGHGFVNMAPWNLVSSKCAADFFMRTGLLDKTALPETPVGELKKYNGEPVETILIKTNRNPTRAALEGRGGKRKREVPAATKKEGL